MLFFSAVYCPLLYSLQTITNLNLKLNNIGCQGIQYLANVLQVNKVLIIFSSFISYSFLLLNKDNHDFGSKF